jgi:hypothetical protein
MVVRYNGVEIDRSAGVVKHRGRQYRAQRRRLRTFRMLEALVLGGGMSNAQLFWAVYGDDADGGPMEGPHIFWIMLCKSNPLFEHLDFDLRSTKIAGVMFHELFPKHRF